MLRLDVMGRIECRDANGAELTAVLAQSKRFALLVYLALNATSGAVRRDTLLALFWPRLDQEHARKALNKAVHFLRQELGEGAIRSRGAEEIGLDHSLLTCDALGFVAMLEARDYAAALELYHGDFLPGFHAEAAPEFERWLDETRARLRREAARAARVLAEQFEQDGRASAALSYARRAVELSDDDERTVRKILELLDRVGDRAGALRAYERFEQRMAAEFDSKPAAETQALIGRIRARNEPAAVVDGNDASTHSGVAEPESTSDDERIRRAHRRRQRVVVVTALAGLAAFAGMQLAAPGWWQRLTTMLAISNARPAGDVELAGKASGARDAKWILVADFDGPANDPALGPVVRDVVNSVIDASNTLATVPHDQLSDARHAAMIPDTAKLDIERARHLALRSAVGIVIDGRVDQVGANDNIVVRATNVSDGSVLASEQGGANEKNFLLVVQRLATNVRDKLIGRNAVRAEPELGAATPSFAAYRKYVTAKQDSIADERRAQLLWEAVALDSNFAAAWNELGFTLHQLGSRDSSRMAYYEGRRSASRLTRRERMMLEANIAHDVDRDWEGALRWWDRIIVEEPSFGPAYEFRTLALRDVARYDDAIASCQRAIVLSPLGARPEFIVICGETMAAAGRVADARKLSGRLTGAAKQDLDFDITLDAGDWSAAESLATRMLAGPLGAGRYGVQAYGALASAHAARGEITAAQELLRRAASVAVYPGSMWMLQLLLATASGGRPQQYEDPPGFRDGVSTPPAAGENPAFWNRMLFPMWAAWRGDTLRAMKEFRTFRAEEIARKEKPRLEGSLVEAWIMSREQHWERVPQLLGADAWRGVNGNWPGTLNLRRWLVGEAYARMGRLDSAAAYFGTLTTATRSNWYQAQSRGMVHSFALRRLALLDEQLGRPDSARVHWQRFIDAFTRPDGELQPLVLEGRKALARLRR